MTTRAHRERHVVQLLTNLRIEGVKPAAADELMLTAYIDGTASLDDLLEHAREFAMALGGVSKKTAVDIHDFLVCQHLADSLLMRDDGQAGQSHLNAGREIYYCEDAYPDEMVCMWPDGRRDLVMVGYDGKVNRTRPYPQ